MKIAIDGTSIVHGTRAVCRHSKNLIKTMVRLYSDYEYKIFYMDRKSRHRRYVKLPDGRFIREYIVSAPGKILIPGWKYLSLPKAEWFIGNFDIFYATDLFFPPSARGIVLGTVHGLAYYAIEDKLVKKETSSLKNGLAYTLRHADYLLAVSNQTRKELIQFLNIPKERIYVVNHGLDPHFRILNDRANLYRRLKRRFGIRDSYILFVGVIGYHKNIMGLLKSYEILRDQGVKLPLVIAGPPGSAWKEVQNWKMKKGWENCLFTVGLIGQNNGELRDLYNGASLFVFPSFYEGWTAPPLEAMACGTPVVTSNCSSIPETVGEAAIKVDPNNPKELAKKIKEVFEEKSLKDNLINKGLAHIKLHTWEKAAKKMNDVFIDIKSKGPWRG
jgi:glycosyltransferase involved in cell wall biosynthesis